MLITLTIRLYLTTQENEGKIESLDDLLRDKTFNMQNHVWIRLQSDKHQNNIR